MFGSDVKWVRLKIYFHTHIDIFGFSYGVSPPHRVVEVMVEIDYHSFLQHPKILATSTSRHNLKKTLSSVSNDSPSFRDSLEESFLSSNQDVNLFPLGFNEISSLVNRKLDLS